MDDVVTITGRKFALSVRGYDQDEVDGFLRILATRLNNGSDPAAEAARIASVTRFTVVTLGYARNEVHQYLNDLRLLLMRRAGAPIVSDVVEAPRVAEDPAGSADEGSEASPPEFAPSATYPWLMAPAEQLPVVEEPVAQDNHKDEVEIETEPAIVTEPAPAAEPEAPAADPVSEEVMAALRRARDALNAFEARVNGEVAELGGAVRRQRDATQRECLELVESAERDAERMMERARLRIAEMAASAERDDLAIRARAEAYADRIRRSAEAGALRETVEAAGQTAASMPGAEPATEAMAPSHAGSDAPAAGEIEDGPGVVGLTRDIIKLLQGRPVPDQDRG